MVETALTGGPLGGPPAPGPCLPHQGSGLPILADLTRGPGNPGLPQNPLEGLLNHSVLCPTAEVVILPVCGGAQELVSLTSSRLCRCWFQDWGPLFENSHPTVAASGLASLGGLSARHLFRGASPGSALPPHACTSWLPQKCFLQPHWKQAPAVSFMIRMGGFFLSPGEEEQGRD